MSARVLDLTARSPAPIFKIEASRCCEMLIQLQRFTWQGGGNTYEDDHKWLRALRANTPSRLRSVLKALGGGSDLWPGLAGMALETPSDVGKFVASVERLSGPELRKISLGSRRPTLQQDYGRLIERAARGERAAIERLLKVELDTEQGGPIASPRLLSLDPTEAKGLTVEALRRWYEEVFAPQEEVIAGVLTRDAQAKRAFAKKHSGSQLVEFATNGLELSLPSWARRVVLLPHIAMRPWNLLNEWDDTFIIAYPAADESLASHRAEPPASLVRLFRALGDDSRLQILKLLSRESASLQEIANKMGIARSTAHHHMVILRAAGLVRSGTDVHSRYSPRPQLLGEAPGLLETYLREQ